MLLEEEKVTEEVATEEATEEVKTEEVAEEAQTEAPKQSTRDKILFWAGLGVTLCVCVLLVVLVWIK